MDNFFTELKRRNVFRVGVAYVITAWLVAQVADLALESFEAPPWVMKSILLVLVIGFPMALVFAWAFEKTPEGIKLEKNVDRSQSITHVTGKKLDRSIIAVLAVAVVVLVYREATGPATVPAGPAAQSTQTASVRPASPALPEPVAPPVDERSIAVLPFANLSDQESNAFFASGMHEDILTYLSKVADLRVISRTSVLRYAGYQGDLRQVARELGVNHILEGSVRRAGNRVRVTAQLIDARDDQHVWAENFDRELTDVFAIQTEVAQEIVKALQASLSQREAEMIAVRPTSSVEAYDAFLQAREILRGPEYSSDKYSRALPLFQRAIELDPDFALAYVKLAEVYGQLYWLVAEDETFRARASEALEQARRLAPDLPEVRAGAAEFYYRIHSDFARALEEFQLALAQTPNDGDMTFQLGMTQRRLGLWDESVASLRRAMSLDPGNQHLVTVLAETLEMQRRWREAVEVLQSAQQRNPEYPVFRVQEAVIRLNHNGELDFARQVLASVPQVPDINYTVLATQVPWMDRDYAATIRAWSDSTNPMVASTAEWEALSQISAGKAYRAMGEAETARRFFRHAIRTTQDNLVRGGIDTYTYHLHRALSHAYLDEDQQAMTEIERAVEMRPESRDALFGTLVSIGRAEVLMVTGRTDQALSEIDRLLHRPYGLTVWILRLDPTWDPLREHPRFQALVSGGEPR